MNRAINIYFSILLSFISFQFHPLITSANEIAERETIDNESVIRLATAGLSEEVIIQKIKTSRIDFDLSTDALINLKENGVGGKTIEAMMQYQPPLQRPQPETPTSTSLPSQETYQRSPNDISPPYSQLRRPLRRGGCEDRLAEFLRENPEFDPEKEKRNIRTGSFQLNAKNKIQVFGSLSERAAKGTRNKYSTR